MPNLELDAFFEKIRAQGLRLTYDDVRLETDYSNLLPADAKLQSKFSIKTPLLSPVVSSAMDTVTESRMAIAMAELGGLGIIHRNMDPKIQAKEVKRVKHHLNGLIEEPICVRHDQTLAEIKAMRESKRFKFHSFPVLQDGKMVGLLTGSDFRFATGDQETASEAMTPYDEHMVIGSKTTTINKAYAEMRKCKKKVLPLLENDHVVGMYVLSDLERITSGTSLHNVDSAGHLIAFAAIGAGKTALERAELLVQAGCDGLVVDTAHGYSKNVLDVVEAVKNSYDIQVVAGNVSRGVAAVALVQAGADGILVGQGPGSICTTRVTAGVGSPQVSAVYDCAKALEGTGVPLSADGGIQHPGDIAIALAGGAASVTLGNILAGTDKSPGDIVQTSKGQKKHYRGMGSRGAMLDSPESRGRYGQGEIQSDKLVPEGVEGLVPYVGPLDTVLYQYLGGVRAAMGYLGAETITDFQEKAEMFRITNAGLKESHPHDIVQLWEMGLAA